MEKKFYITTPIYYVNAEPTLGSVYTTIAADVLARWHKLKGEDVFFLTGTDEHGQKIQEVAKKAGLKPKQFVDKIVKKFKETFKLLDISNDYFIRTTNKKHETEVKKILQELYEKKYIYKGYYESYYCVGCEQYLTKSDLVDGKCPLHNKKPELRKEKAYLFKLSAFQKKLLKLIKTKQFNILPKQRRKEIINFIESGLQDIPISRLKEKVYWGIKLPFDKNYTCYVWIDAFWNYITGLKNKKVFEKFWPPDIQLIGKDILRVHATIWPALLLATKNKPPKILFAHGFFTINGKKISKSLGNIIDPVYLVKKYGSDAVRYFLIRHIPFGGDGDFSEDALKRRINGELVNGIGNLVSRVLSLAVRYRGKIKGEAELKINLEKISRLMDNFELHNALNEIWNFIKEVNKYINENEPWKLKGKELGKVIYNLLESLRIISILISPFMPETSKKINRQLGVKKGLLKDCVFKKFKGKIKKGEYLFKRV